MSGYNQTRSFNFGIAKETSIEAALVFDELSFWASKNKSGWVYKSYDEMTERLTISKFRLCKAYKQLVDMGYMEMIVKKANGFPTLHFRLLKNLTFHSEEISLSMDSEKTSLSITATTHSNYTKATPLESALQELKQHRKEMKRAMTTRSYELVKLKLEKMSPGDDATKIAIINQTIENGWSGVFELKQETIAREKVRIIGGKEFKGVIF